MVSTTTRRETAVPHSGNSLSTPSGLLLLDFETACRGPLEWDLSAMRDDDIRAFPSVDRDALSLLRRVRTLCVAVTLDEPDRGIESTDVMGRWCLSSIRLESHTSTAKPRSTSSADLPPRIPQFAIGGSWRTIVTSSAGTPASPKLRTIAL